MLLSASRFFLALLLSLCLMAPCLAGDFPAGGSLTPEQGMTLLEKQEGLTVLDVRTKREFDEGHVPGALHIPVGELMERAAEVPEGPVLIVCRSGRRAKNAAVMLVRGGRAPEGLWYLSGYADYSGKRVRFHD